MKAVVTSEQEHNKGPAAVVEMRRITKVFPGVKALDGVDLILYPGKIHALLGENGAGKTTLMKILSGMYQPDAGEIRLNGRIAAIRTPREAISRRIGMVYQNFTLSPELTVLENIVLGSKIPFFWNKDRLAVKVKEIIDAYGLQVDLNAKVWQLTVGEQQRTEIIKCFYHGANILILDEPTSVLTPPEIQDLFMMMRRAAAEGRTLVFISHKLGEVLEIADTVTIFRKGRLVESLDKRDASAASLSRAMIGREVNLENTSRCGEAGKMVLAVEKVSAKNDKGLPALEGLSFQLFAGEILGIAAVSGNGQGELAEILTGLRPVTGGRIILEEKVALHSLSIKKIIRAGISHIPEKRLNRALIPGFSVALNLISKDYDKPPYIRRGILNGKVIRNHGQALIEQYGVAAPGPETPVEKLSGGNLQKVVLAREIERNPKVIIAVNPTYGLDVGAIEFVQEKLMEQRERQAAILLISEELDEVLRLSDRVAVMVKGKIVGLFSKDNFDREKIGLLMTGGRSA